MLKFSGYSYLIRGQPYESGGFNGVAAPLSGLRGVLLRRGGYSATADRFGGREAAGGDPIPNTGPPEGRGRRSGGPRVEMTLEQACPPEYWRAQCAFKDSMIH